MRLVALIGCAALMEAGWLAMWPLSGALSHSPLFTAALLETHPLVNSIFDRSISIARAVLPTLSETPIGDKLGSPTFTVPAVALAAVMVWLAITYVAALFLARRMVRAAWLIIPAAVVFQATLAYLPGLFSQDVFSYIAYGRLSAVYELNPYIWPPSVLRDPVVPWVAEIWRGYPSPYGPLQVDVQWAIAHLTRPLSIEDQALVYRFVSNALLLLNLALVWLLLGRLVPLNRQQRTVGLAALAWNPLLLFEIGANAHNDVLMISFSLIALLLFSLTRSGLLTTVPLALGTLVKYVSGLGLLWLALANVARSRSWPVRFAVLVAMAIIAGGLAIVAAAPWLELPDSLDPLLAETTNVGYVNALPDRLAMALTRYVGTPLDVSRGAERALVWACFAIYLGWEARNVWRQPAAASVAMALARSCLVYVLLVSTSMQTWYLCLPISIAAGLGVGNRPTQMILGYSLLALPALHLSYYLRDATPGWVFVVYGLAPWLVFVPGLAVTWRLRARRRALEPAMLESAATAYGE